MNQIEIDNKRRSIINTLNILKKITKHLTPPLIDRVIKDYGKDPFLILISCLLSLRSRDSKTYLICKKLFEYLKTPQDFIKVNINKIEELIHGVNYYKNKAKILKEVSQTLIEKFNGQVPNNEQDLLSLKGVGPKTANIVLSYAFNVPSIAVDTHVQKLANQLGWVNTTNPEATEKELKQIVPKSKWSDINYYLVIWGQNIKNPIFKELNKNLNKNKFDKIL